MLDRDARRFIDFDQFPDLPHHVPDLHDSMSHQNGHTALLNDVVSDTAKHKLLEPAVAVRTEHQKLRTIFLRLFLQPVGQFGPI